MEEKSIENKKADLQLVVEYRNMHRENNRKITIIHPTNLLFVKNKNIQSKNSCNIV
jgi:hypothetical protein